MGIDVYMHWREQTAEEEELHFGGPGYRLGAFERGQYGYLRESYHGNIYATRTLVPEAFGDFDYDAEPCGAQIPARLLADRTEAAVKLVYDRYRETYDCDRDHPETQKAVRNLIDFVELAKRKEAETGEPVWIYASW